MFTLFEDRPLYYNVTIRAEQPLTVSGFQKAAVLNAKTPYALTVLNCTLELELKSADKIPLSGIAAEQNMPLTISGSELAVTLRSAGTASLLTQL